MVTRIRQLLEEKQLTPTQFADLIGIGRPVVSHILSERNKPSLEVVQRIIDAFPGMSLPWLLRGTGPMLVEGGNTPIPPTSSNKEAAEPAAEKAAATAAPTPPIETLLATPTPTVAAKPSSQAAVVPAPKTNAASFPPTFFAAAAAPPAIPRPFRVAPSIPTAVWAPPSAVPVAPLQGAGEMLTPATGTRAPTRFLPEPGGVASPAVASAGPPTAAQLPFPVELGKGIRRIVIFYHDGSFTDYQPEA
ncbi:helix-turn-helix domain-containing protein [Hymenobacter psoromatis]|uniref:helix-turn-helix domain-containing protein n=1 Tax=Hymenobacter psoromatis TaxID=1484116 RepID=UPI001CC09428|nr:helix-turn-helix transcriptional regulator [Hymenobacter psoromatis]